jgi:NADPH-dependent glutamate synthase beta subunit-like oxidoreductase
MGGRFLCPELTAPPRRPPYLLESSVPGVFAAGEVRAGSVKRVASAVGEGSICVQFVHRLLREFAEGGNRPAIVAASGGHPA